MGLKDVTNQTKITANIPEIPLNKTGTYLLTIKFQYNNKISQKTSIVYVCSNDLNCNEKNTGCK